MTSDPSASTPGNAERRQSRRRQFRGKIEIEWGSATLTATIRDIGPEGLFVELLPPLWVGARFMARVVTNPVLELDCIVRRVEPGRGIGVSFDVSEEAGKAQLKTLLASLPQV